MGAPIGNCNAGKGVTCSPGGGGKSIAQIARPDNERHLAMFGSMQKRQFAREDKISAIKKEYMNKPKSIGRKVEPDRERHLAMFGSMQKRQFAREDKINKKQK